MLDFRYFNLKVIVVRFISLFLSEVYELKGFYSFNNRCKGSNFYVNSGLA